jgi:hypothetical protein
VTRALVAAAASKMTATIEERCERHARSTANRRRLQAASESNRSGMK